MNSKESLLNSITNETTQNMAEADSAISLLGKALLPKAAELARAGKYLEAECLLLHLVQEGYESPVIYDLLARIRAQQGRLLEAQSYWADAIRLSPTKGCYRAALKRIEHLQTAPAWVLRLRPLLVGLSLLTGLILVFTTAVFNFGKLKLPAANTATMVDPQPVVTAPVKPPPHIRINIPGVNLDYRDDQIVISFESGLFSRQTELRPEAKAMLDLLAEQLQPYKGKILANIEGHTDNLPILNNWIYRDNVALGLQRAVTVIEYLRLKGDFPAEMFKASSTGELNALYPNDTLHNQLRNRTVVIRITAVQTD